MKRNKNRSLTALWSVTFCRLLLSAVFITSGFVKAVDPLGMGYKLDAYFSYLSLPLHATDTLTLFGVVTLATAEFVLGIYLLLGIRRRFTTTAVLLMMGVMTLISAYLYLFDPVEDCGCFGAAWTLSHGMTFAKNMVLLAASIVVYRKKRLLLRLITERNQWLTSVWSWVYIILLSLYSLQYLPSMDFTPFKKGTDLREAYYNYTPTSDIPASLAGLDFSTTDGESMTDSILMDKGLVFLLTLPDLVRADDGCNDRINDLCDVCRDNGYRFYALVSYGEADSLREQWTDRTGATYEYLLTDETALKSMVRSNPGLMLIDNGVIVGKWSNNNLPETVAEGTKAHMSGIEPLRISALRSILWFVLPLALVILIDRLWIGSKYYRHYRIKKTFNQLKTTNMRKKIVAGNWKMNKTLQEGVALAQELKAVLAEDKPNCSVVICTPFIHLATVAEELEGTVIGLGAENCADKVSGAYTGEVSAAMVKSTGAQYVILGHSERRAYYHETPEILKEKIGLALENNLEVIFCIGEVLEERESGKQNEVVKAQLEGSLFGLTAEQMKHIILAYEPVWAIGTGKTATADQAEEMHAFIRGVIAEKFGAETAEETSILYGGSCKPSNAKEIFAKVNVDGGLIGGAALKAADFKGIIDAWK